MTKVRLKGSGYRKSNIVPVPSFSDQRRKQTKASPVSPGADASPNTGILVTMLRGGVMPGSPEILFQIPYALPSNVLILKYLDELKI